MQGMQAYVRPGWVALATTTGAQSELYHAMALPIRANQTDECNDKRTANQQQQQHQQ